MASTAPSVAHDVAVPKRSRFMGRETWRSAVWRWHFYAGVMVGPILFVVAATGALYVLKDEFERMLSPAISFVQPRESRASYEQIIKSAREHVQAKRVADLVEFDADPSRPVSVLFFGGDDEPFHRVHVDPYTGQALGEFPESAFFPAVLRVHRELYAGTTGRIITELSVSWTIVLLVTGVFLWWPRRWRQLGGVFWPRWRQSKYVLWRDLHALAGLTVMPVAATIAVTGLMFTIVWGQAFHRVADYTNSYQLYADFPKSIASIGSPRITLDEVVRLAQQEYSASPLSIDLPEKADDSYVVSVGRTRGPTVAAVIAYDAYSGAELAHRRHADSTLLQRWINWNFRLHIGTVLGLPSKIIWLCTCLVLMCLPATGACMWWQRRPAGTTGFPRSRQGKLPRGAYLAMAAMGIALPMFGASVITLLALHAAFRWLRPN